MRINSLHIFCFKLAQKLNIFCKPKIASKFLWRFEGKVTIDNRLCLLSLKGLLEKTWRHVKARSTRTLYTGTFWNRPWMGSKICCHWWLGRLQMNLRSMKFNHLSVTNSRISVLWPPVMRLKFFFRNFSCRLQRKLKNQLTNRQWVLLLAHSEEMRMMSLGLYLSMLCVL